MGTRRYTGHWNRFQMLHETLEPLSNATRDIGTVFIDCHQVFLAENADICQSRPSNFGRHYEMTLFPHIPRIGTRPQPISSHPHRRGNHVATTNGTRLTSFLLFSFPDKIYMTITATAAVPMPSQPEEIQTIPSIVSKMVLM